MKGCFADDDDDTWILFQYNFILSNNIVAYRPVAMR
jgi:hypothetical protein